MLDVARDSDSSRVLPYMIPTLLELLRTVEVALRKDAPEYPFRRALLEILNRLPVHDHVRQRVNDIVDCLVYILRHDNEENGVTSCKTMVDLLRNYRSQESLPEFASIFQEGCVNMKGLVVEVLSEDSVPLDPNDLLPCSRSFKVLGEMGLIMAMFAQAHRALIPSMQTSLAPALEVITLESSAQKTAREDFEAMGNFWAGMAPSIKNAVAYNDFISAQIKV